MNPGTSEAVYGHVVVGIRRAAAWDDATLALGDLGARCIMAVDTPLFAMKSDLFCFGGHF